LNWFQEAICIGKDPELFFPIGSTGPAAIQAERAKSVCVGCPVREECLDWALTTGQDAGVWGGLSEEERRALKRARRRERLAVG
jgi:WhiB family transcriptional regulator, redox-sensing transcriptional regulator